MYECLNIVAERDGVAGCVLIRALEPVAGLEEMRARRRPVKCDFELANGPGKLTLAMGIDRSHYGLDLTRKGRMTVRDTGVGHPEIAVGTRIGIRESTDLPLRFWLAGNPSVSRAYDSRPKASTK